MFQQTLKKHCSLQTIKNTHYLSCHICTDLHKNSRVTLKSSSHQWIVPLVQHRKSLQGFQGTPDSLLKKEKSLKKMFY